MDTEEIDHEDEDMYGDEDDFLQSENEDYGIEYEDDPNDENFSLTKPKAQTKGGSKKFQSSIPMKFQPLKKP